MNTWDKANRESPPIFTNRIFLAPSCSAPAYRLRRNRTPSGKMLSEKPACGFFFFMIVSFNSNVFFGVRGRDSGAERPAVGYLLIS